MTMLKRELTLHFRYKDLGGNVGDYEAFLTSVVEANDSISYEKELEWLNKMIEIKVKADPDVAGCYISDEVLPLTKQEIKQFKKNNVISLTKKESDKK